MRTLVLTAFATAAATCAFATPALAQDMTFTGPRIGVIAGYDGIRPGSTEDSDIAGDDQTADGLLYGIDAGYDYDFGQAVVGAEAEISGSTGKVTNETVDTDNLGYGRVKAGRDLYLGVRAGFKATPATLIYAKGGYTNQRLDLIAGDEDSETGDHFNLDGYRLGAGVEQKVGTNAYAKLEYRYSNYGDARLEFANGENTNNFSVDTDRHQVVAGVGWRF